MVSDIPDRVACHTCEEDNRKIEQGIRDNVALYGGGNEEVIERRLRELDAEWDIERMLEFNTAALATTAIVFGLAGKKRWLLLAGAVTGFLAQHALRGWCPPVPMLRHLGFRTAQEIDRERYALKILRGDFKDVQYNGEATSAERVEAVLDAVR